MQTDTVHGYALEVGDFVVMDEDTTMEVTFKDDDGDFILANLKDEDGEVTQIPFGPFDTVTIVSRFDEDVEFEDVEVE